jgi:CubicO group peptidase (beta-lactamase class C family)
MRNAFPIGRRRHERLVLEDSITSHLPELPNRWAEVTVWNLLTHTSGIKGYTQLSAIADNPTKDFSAAEMIALVADLPLEFAPGERYNYSNSGYYLLGLLIERISGQGYGDFLKDRTFGPAAMRDTRVNSASDIIPNRAAGYVLSGNGIANGTFFHVSWRSG